MLKLTLMRRYNDLFDLAEKAVEADNTFLKEFNVPVCHFSILSWK